MKACVLAFKGKTRLGTFHNLEERGEVSSGYGEPIGQQLRKMLLVPKWTDSVLVLMI